MGKVLYFCENAFSKIIYAIDTIFVRKNRPRHLNTEHWTLSFTLSDVDIIGVELKKIEYTVEEMKTQCEFNLMVFFIVEFR